MPQKTSGFGAFRAIPKAVLVPAGIGIVSILLELGGAPVREVLRYARPGLEEGELWRLLTGHLVHLGPSHMLMNVLALGVLAFLFLPFMQTREWLLTGLAAALAIAVGLYWFHPEVQWYVGLSGVLHGFWSGACLLGLVVRRAEALALLILLLGKLAYEGLFGPVPMTGQIAAGPVVTEAHAWGAAGAALAALTLLAIRHWRRPL
jgi:rhomboid family GlyGly-CTERM serine protease